MNAPTIWHVGAEDVHMRIPLLLALRQRGFRVGAVGTAAGAAFAPHDIPYWRYSLGRGLNPFEDRATVKQLSALFRRQRPDIVHAFDTKPALLTPLAASRAGVRGRVRTITGMGFVFSSNSALALALRPVYRLLQQRAAKATSVTVFQNDDDRRYFLQHSMADPQRSPLVAGSGIDIEQFLARRPDDATVERLRRELRLGDQKVVTMVSRLAKTKGVIEYLDAAKIVRARRQDVRFLLVGPQPVVGRQAIPGELLDQAADAVDWLGARDDVPALLALTDIFALPSYYREGVPRSLLEAAAFGLPMITTDMPGCKEVVQDGRNGRLVPPRDAAALADAVLGLLDSERDRVAMGQYSRRHVEQFSLPRVADQYAEVYRRVLREPQSRTAGRAPSRLAKIEDR